MKQISLMLMSRMHAACLGKEQPCIYIILHCPIVMFQQYILLTLPLFVLDSQIAISDVVKL